MKAPISTVPLRPTPLHQRVVVTVTVCRLPTREVVRVTAAVVVAAALALVVALVAPAVLDSPDTVSAKQLVEAI